jgi:hypothetical protein
LPAKRAFLTKTAFSRPSRTPAHGQAAAFRCH